MADAPSNAPMGGCEDGGSGIATIHGTAISVEGVGVLIRGPSGSGKSDLALRMIDGGAHLVADDRVVIEHVNGALEARAPKALQGMIEVRGLGIVSLLESMVAPVARIELVVDLSESRADIERMPEAERVDLEVVEIRRLRLWPFEASAAAKVRLAIRLKSETITT
jgi:HPr kinase/phosphorylase